MTMVFNFMGQIKPIHFNPFIKTSVNWKIKKTALFCLLVLHRIDRQEKYHSLIRKKLQILTPYLYGSQNVIMNDGTYIKSILTCIIMNIIFLFTTILLIQSCFYHFSYIWNTEIKWQSWEQLHHITDITSRDNTGATTSNLIDVIWCWVHHCFRVLRLICMLQKL